MHLRKPLPPLTRYTFGTGRLFGREESFYADVKVTRAAMDAEVWFHTSSDYSDGRVFRVLRHAFDEARSQVPPCIVKVFCSTAEKTRTHVEEILSKLNIDTIAIAQLCCGADFTEDFRVQGPRWQTFQALQEEGKVGNYVVEIFHPASQNAIQVAQDDMMDAYIFYYNAMERQVSNDLYALLVEKKRKLISLRTVSGRYVDFSQLDDLKKESPEDKSLPLLEALKPIYERSGSANWLEFNLRFILSMPEMLTTIGATREITHLKSYLEAERSFQPMESGLTEEIKALHRKWFP